jgi:hypothetical protein
MQPFSAKQWPLKQRHFHLIDSWMASTLTIAQRYQNEAQSTRDIKTRLKARKFMWTEVNHYISSSGRQRDFTTSESYTYISLPPLSAADIGLYYLTDRRSEPKRINGFFPQNINQTALPDQPHCQSVCRTVTRNGNGKAFLIENNSQI